MRKYYLIQNLILVFITLIICQSTSISQIVSRMHINGLANIGYRTFSYGINQSINYSTHDTIEVGYIMQHNSSSLKAISSIEFPDLLFHSLKFGTDSCAYGIATILTDTVSAYNISREVIANAKGKLALFKLSKDLSQITYTTLIPNSKASNTIFALDSKNEVYFATTTEPQIDSEYTKKLTAPDSIYTITDSAFQTKIRPAKDGTYSADIYLAKLSSDWKSIEYSTFLGSDGFDRPIKMVFDTNNRLTLLSEMQNIGGFGSAPTTPTAFQDVLPADSLANFSFETFLYPSIFTTFSDNFQKLTYCSYYSYGKISDMTINYKNRLNITGWNRKNDAELPKGSFVATFNLKKTDFEDFISVSKYSKLDTLRNTIDNSDSLKPIIADYSDNLNTYIHNHGFIAGSYLTGLDLQNDSTREIDIFSNSIYYFMQDYPFYIYSKYEGSSIGIKNHTTDKCLGICDAPPISTEVTIIILGESDNTEIVKPSEWFGSYKPYPESKQFMTHMLISSCSVEDEIPSSFALFPNPASEFINIDEAMLNGTNNIEIINALGVKILEATPTGRINISALSAGIYTIRCGNKVKSFIKQ